MNTNVSAFPNDRSDPIDFGIAVKGVGVCFKGRFEGWVFIQHPDGNWVSACQLSPAMWRLFKGRALVDGALLIMSDKEGAECTHCYGSGKDTSYYGHGPVPLCPDCTERLAKDGL